MEQTADMFGMPAIARKRDPATSKIAAAEYTETRRQGDCDLMLSTIREFPGKTAGEYGDIFLNRGMKPMKAIRMPTKRISDIKDKLVVGPRRKCIISGRLAQTYYVRTDHL